jgi:hypothetical protein
MRVSLRKSTNEGTADEPFSISFVRHDAEGDIDSANEADESLAQSSCHSTPEKPIQMAEIAEAVIMAEKVPKNENFVANDVSQFNQV